MIEHAEDTSVQRRQRLYRPTLALTRCNRWVDVIRLALPERPVTCTACRRAMEGES